MIPSDLWYTKEHEWVRFDGQSATMGITHHAQEQLGEITFVELPAPARRIKAMDPIGSVESSKAASEVYSPVAGEITEVNGRLESEPELINQSCYQDGWLCKIQAQGGPETFGLMNAGQYEQYLQEQ
ncbi:MAG: glycine cleavage system protein GcvH [Sedimentisphaerales bacterium]|nr:glycine cleavage system protein GcvH [Sedimentisphaerales bacterium]